jgi:hypothetical protein
MTSTSQPTQQAEHPYRRVQDTTYQPPAACNFGAPMKQPIKNPETVPKVLPPIHDPFVAANIYKCSIDVPIMVTQHELLFLSPEVCSQVREATTTHCTQPKDPSTAQNLYQYSEDEQADDYINTLALTPTNTPPPGSIIVEDPIELYYKSLCPGEEPDFDTLVIAKESSAVRSIVALVDNNRCVNCILDPGCQIIAMSENVCHKLGLAYNPSIKLNMQSANGNIDQSLRLSRNVPFRVHTITLYMQVHVICSPAYDILLGRPFDILTESIIRNFANEDQTITIHDPNTNSCITILIIACGPPKWRHLYKPNQGFHRPGA